MTIDVAATRFLTSTMCDDVRLEAGNKLSIMGSYVGGAIVVPQFPFTVAKLCFLSDLIILPPDSGPRGIKFRVYRDEELINENLMQPEFDVSKVEDRDQKRMFIRSIFAVFPLTLHGPGRFKVRALCDDMEEEIKGGAWEIVQGVTAVAQGIPGL